MSVSNKGFTTTDGIDLNEVLYSTVLPILDLYNAEEVLDLRSLLCTDWDESYYKFDASGKWKFKILAEAEKPTARKKVYGKRQKDTTKYGLDIDYTFDWLMSDMSSAAEIASLANKAVSRDRALQTAVILDAGVQSAGTDGFYNGSFSANEKMSAPPTYGANTFTAAHSHYVGAGSATLALSYITAAKKHIKEHGYKGNIVGLCNADFFAKIEDICGFYYSATTSYGVPTPVQDQVALDGFKGRLLGIDWKETEWMPDDYFMLVGQTEGQGKPMLHIQKKNPSAHGLILTPGAYDPRYPIIDATYLHWLAAQVVYRGAGVVYKLHASWSAPTAITTNVVE